MDKLTIRKLANDDRITSSSPLIYRQSKALAKRLEELEAKLKMYEDFDSAPDGAGWGPPHPIFLLAEERDVFMKRASKAEAFIKEIGELPDEWIKLTDSDQVSPTEAQGMGTCIDQLKAKFKALIGGKYDGRK